MKTNFLNAALATIVMLTACSKNEVIELPRSNDPALISFDPIASKQTKAIPIDGSELQKDQKMLKLKAYLTKEQDFKDHSDKPDIWIDGTLSYIDSKWTTNYTYYWPSNEKYKLSFFSYYPDKNGPDGTSPIDFTDPQGYINGAISFPRFIFTVPTRIENQVDLIAAAQKDKVRTPAPGVDQYEKIMLQYKHLLSQVYFQAMSAEPTNFSIKISSLKIKGAKNSATFTYDGSSDPVGEWSRFTGSGEHIYRSSLTPDAITTKTKVNPDGKLNDVLMVLPQNPNEDFIIEVIYTVLTPNGQTVFIKDIKKTAHMEKLERGKKYLYTLIMPKDDSLVPIEFDVNVTTWEDPAVEHDIKIHSLKLSETAPGPGTTGWEYNSTIIAGYISEFAKVYSTTDQNGHSQGATYTQTIEINGEMIDDVSIDLNAENFDDVLSGSKIIIDASAITTWIAGKKISIAIPTTGWTRTPDLTSAGKITLTKVD